jgi:DNA-binding CsgD family transcriptional regulator
LNQQRDGVSLSLAQTMLSAGHGMASVELLGRELQRLCTFQNYIVLRFERGRKPALVFTNRDPAVVAQSFQDYMRGVYALDPFYLTQQSGLNGLYRMSEVAPEEFDQSEYYRRHYRHTGVTDELRFLAHVAPDLCIHVLLEQEDASRPFTGDELGTLRRLAPTVLAFMQGEFRCAAWQRDEARPTSPAFSLPDKVRSMAPGLITAREAEVVELILKGHPVKAIGRILNIQDGTVINHKRNIYAKLGVHSQAQLFDLFLRSL